MTELSVTTTDQQKDWSGYRFGQNFTEQTVKEMLDRDPYGHLLCFVLPNRALGNGFDLTNPEDDSILDNNDDIWDVLKDPWEKIVENAAPYERGYGLSDIVIYKNDNSQTDDNHKLFVKVFRPQQINNEVLAYNRDETIQAIAFIEPHPLTGKDADWPVTDLKDLYHNIQRQKEDWHKGRSYLEPIWDELQSLRAIRMGATLFAIRVGAGLKIIKIPPNTPANVVTAMETAAKKLDSLNGFFLLPLDEAEVTIASGQGMVDYHALKRICLEAITAYTGIPMASLIGIEMERQGAEFNQESEDDFKREIQRQYEPIAKWLILRFNEKYEWGLTEESFTLQWRIHEEISDKAQAETDVIRATADAADIASGVITEQEAREARGLTGTAPGKPDMMSFSINDKTDKETDDNESKD